MPGLWLGYKFDLCENKQNKNQRSAAREQVWQHDGREKEAAKHRAEEKDIGRF